MISLPLLSGGHKADEHGSSNENETIASDWVTAGYTGKIFAPTSISVSSFFINSLSTLISGIICSGFVEKK